jgi:hypothetical protein
LVSGLEPVGDASRLSPRNHGSFRTETGLGVASILPSCASRSGRPPRIARRLASASRLAPALRCSRSSREAIRRRWTARSSQTLHSARSTEVRPQPVGRGVDGPVYVVAAGRPRPSD